MLMVPLPEPDPDCGRFGLQVPVSEVEELEEVEEVEALEELKVVCTPIPGTKEATPTSATIAITIPAKSK
jgi:hypothetical protein